MSREFYVLVSDAIRAKVAARINAAEPGTRVELKGPKRSLDQNARMWAMLTDFAHQVEHMGRRYTPEQWKVILLHAFGWEVQFLPSLDGQNILPFGNSTSDLSRAEMAEFQEFISAEGAMRGVTFHTNREDQRR